MLPLSSLAVIPVLLRPVHQFYHGMCLIKKLKSFRTSYYGYILCEVIFRGAHTHTHVYMPTCRTKLILTNQVRV